METTRLQAPSCIIYLCQTKMTFHFLPRSNILRKPFPTSSDLEIQELWHFSMSQAIHILNSSNCADL